MTASRKPKAKPARAKTARPSTATASPVKPPVTVAIGASAGGLTALKRFFSSLPADSGLAFLVVMHLEPGHKSMLDQLLAKETAMPVKVATEGIAVEPNHVYILPPNHELTCRDGRLHLSEPGGGSHLRLPIDACFRSLAALGERCAAIVLSGAGRDGSEGVKAIKEAGGLVLAQNEESADYPDMPRNASATGAVDYVLPPEGIARQLLAAAPLAHLAGTAAGSLGLEKELATIFHLVKTKTGHDFSSYKENMVLRRIQRRMAATGKEDLAAYVARLREHPEEAESLARDLLIGVTSFFRDPEAFETLRSEVFPRLFADRGADDSVRIWHASCSTGEEAYSMAILVQEYLAEQELPATVKIFATDIDEAAIAQARSGCYPRGIEADLSPERLQRFFVASPEGYQVAKSLREMIVFAPHSLLKDPPFSRLDLLVCRNFLIYLKPEMQRQVFALFHLALKPGGTLFLGISETVRPSEELFELVDKRWKIYVRMTSSQAPGSPLPFISSLARFTAAGFPPRAVGGDPAADDMVQRLLLDRYAPPAVVVNENFEVVHYPTGRTGRYLEAPIGKPTRDLLKLARPELRSILRTAIYKAFSDQQRAVFKNVPLSKEPPELVQIEVEPLPAKRLVLVFFETPVSPLPTASPATSPTTLPTDELSREAVVKQLEEQLQLTQEQLQATIEQLEASNEGLMSTNEELLSINEEFQSTNEELHSTNEELETSREELQALNEELVTVNAELQQKVEELNQSNSDMDNLLTSSEIATIFLDRELLIKRFTPAMAELFDLIPADCNRPFHHLSGKIDWPDLPREMARVLAGESAAEREVTTHHGDRVFLARALPYRTPAGSVDGVVVTLVDITERKRLEARTRHLASFPEINPNPVMELDLEGNVRYFNPAVASALLNAGLDVEDATPLVPADVPELLATWDRNTEETHPREVEIGDRTFAATVHLVPELQVVRLNAYDITKRKQAAKALFKSETKYRRALDSMLEGCQIIGFDWRYTYLNTTVEQHSRRPNQELLGKTIMECWPGITDTDLFFRLRESMEQRTTQRLENLFTYPDGKVGWFRLNIQPVDEGLAVYSEDITERKLAELALQESEEQFRIMFMRSSVGKAQADPRSGRFLRVNPALCLMTGYTEEELLQRSFFDVTPPEDREAERANLEALIGGKIDSIQSEKRYLRPDGSVVWGHVTVNLARDPAGTPLHALAVIQDITSRKLAEASLRESESRYRELVQNANSAIIRWKKDGTISFANEYAVEFFGYRTEEIVGQPVSLLLADQPVGGNDLSGLVQDILDHPDRHRNSVNENICKDGRRVWMTWTNQAILDASGNVTEVLAVGSDITEQRHAEQALREQEEIYRAIVDNAADGIVLVDPESGKMVEFNDAACAGLGYSREEFAGLSLADIHPPGAAQEIADRLEKRDLGDLARGNDHIHLTRGGEQRLVEVSSQAVTIRNKSYLAAVWHDVTDRQRAEAEREKSGRLESLGILAGGIAHDFNNILTAVMGNISLAQTRLGENHPAARQLVSSEKALERATALTRQLLTFARGGEPARKVVATGQLLSEVLAFSLHGSPSKGKLAATEPLWDLNADAGQVHQALSNLIINAAQAMPEGGTVTLGASNASLEGRSAGNLPPGRYLKITVTDHGCGINSADLTRIFDPYFTTKEGGTGLGLASAFSIIQRHGGSLQVESKPDHGTTFTVHLPAADACQVAPAAASRPAGFLHETGAGAAVLVMDDEDLIRDLAAEMLTELGYRPVPCSDGEQAVATYREALDRGTPFAAVILDMTVPGAMGGRDAAQQIRQLDPEAVLIISTGYSVESSYRGEEDPLFQGSVAKPYNLEKLGRELVRVTLHPQGS